MAYTNNLYKRSIYFEILSINDDGSDGKLQESFAFTIPPTNIEISQEQRVTTTPTPGGFFVDNYGLGAAKISITGDTGNQQAKMTVLGSDKTERKLTGQEAWFEFRDRIVRYSLENQEYRMKFYDLTNKGSSDIFQPISTNSITTARPSNAEAWEVVLDQSSLRKTSAKPFFYPFTINLTGIKPLGTYTPQATTKTTNVLTQIADQINAVTVELNALNGKLNTFLANNFEYISQITSVSGAVVNFTKSLNSFSATFTEYQNKLAGLTANVISDSEELLTEGVNLIEFPYDALTTAQTQLEGLSTYLEILIDDAVADGKNVLDKYDWIENDDPVSSLSSTKTAIEYNFNQIVQIAKQGASYEPVGAVSVNDEVYQVYGLTTYTVKGSTRLDRLAYEQYGDTAYKDVICALNEVYSNDELTSGDTLKLPILEVSTRYADNAVYNLPEEASDVIGRDAKLDSNGAFVCSPTDYILVTNDDNLLQAVACRLAEKQGRQIQHGTYGIVTEIGSALTADASFEYLQVGLQETLVQDPRITDVYNLKFLIDSDKIYQTFSFDTITKEQLEYAEGL